MISRFKLYAVFSKRFFAPRIFLVRFRLAFKKDPVLFISGFLAVVSCFIIPPSIEYLDYINFRVLGLLFCLMGIVIGMRAAGAFDLLSNALLKKTHSLRGLSFALMTLCFFLSMFLTNDVALVTVVPFTILVFGNIDAMCAGAKKSLCPVLVLETVAANLGSMLTPIGNPQNLFLFAHYEMEMGEFLGLTAPYAGLAFVVLAGLTVVMVGKKEIGIGDENTNPKIATPTEQGAGVGISNGHEGIYPSGQSGADASSPKGTAPTLSKSFYIYIVLFVLALLTVVRVIHWIPLLAIVSVVIFFQNKKLFARIDYALLVTFVFFFVFVGNMGKIPALRDFLEMFVKGREVICAVCASQVISNVPAALLLSSFTENGAELVVGTNLGGLGTLVASMASLITYKFCAAEDKGRYLAVFTVVNVGVLVVMLGLAVMLF